MIKSIKKSEFKLDYINDLFAQNYAVVKIDEFINKMELSCLLASIAAFDFKTKFFFDKAAGWAYPLPFSLVNEYDRAIYLEKCRCDFIIDLIHNITIESFIFNYFLTQTGLSVLPLTLGARFNFASPPMLTYRHLNSGSGGMNTHRGIELNRLYHASFYEHITCPIDLDLGQLGFFLQLQKPDSGGVLRVFEGEVTENKFIDIESKIGELVLVNESAYWHAVTPISGHTDRLTIGGFLSYAQDKKSFYAWS
jgi:hypothetical protein